MFPMRRPPFDPNLGQPHKLPPTPTQRQMQMQAAHRGRGRGPGGWQGGGEVGAGRTMNPRAAGAAAMLRNRPRPVIQGRMGRGPVLPPQPRGWQGGGSVRGFAQGDLATADPREALMAEREMLQQQLQMADEVTAQEIMAQIMEINKELEMAAAPGMAGGGVASLMGYQGGGAPRRTGALHGSIIGDPSSGRWTQHFPAIGQNPIYSGWGNVSWNPNKWSTVTNFNNQNLPYPNRPPGGG